MFAPFYKTKAREPGPSFGVPIGNAQYIYIYIFFFLNGMWHIFAKRYIAFYFPVAGPENRETHTDDRCSRKKSRPTYALQPFVVGMKSIAKIEACKIKMMIVF